VQLGTGALQLFCCSSLLLIQNSVQILNLSRLAAETSRPRCNARAPTL
jgi:hypothetical protein